MAPNGSVTPAQAELDDLDRRLLLALSQDGRQSASGLGEALGLSRQAIAERMRDLEQRGVIRGYRADVDPGALGLAVKAQLRLTLDARAEPAREREAIDYLAGHPFVRSVYRVSGEDCVVADVVCRRIEDVNTILGRLSSTRAIQSSRTSFVLETVVDKRGLGPFGEELLARVEREEEAP